MKKTGNLLPVSFNMTNEEKTNTYINNNVAGIVDNLHDLSTKMDELKTVMTAILSELKRRSN